MSQPRTDKELMQQALEALAGLLVFNPSPNEYRQGRDAVTALRERLAQPEQDAVLAEREACEKIQFKLRERYISQNKTAQAEIMLLTAVSDYAAAIRARGQDPMPLFDDWGKDWTK